MPTLGVFIEVRVLVCVNLAPVLKPLAGSHYLSLPGHLQTLDVPTEPGTGLLIQS